MVRNNVKIRLESGRPKKDLSFLFGKKSADISGGRTDVLATRYRGEKEVTANYIAPPLDPDWLAVVPMRSEIISAHIDAMEQNIVGFGWQVRPLSDNPEDGDSNIVRAQADELRFFFRRENSNNQKITAIAKLMVRDRETFGYAFAEVVRKNNGDIGSIYFLPARTIRIRQDEIINGRLQHQGYVQIDRHGAPKCYYKKFGDGRQLNYKTGKYAKAVSYDSRATELIMFKINSTVSNYYGLPRYIPAEFAILGNYFSSRSNYNRFRNNCVPDKLIVVANGVVATGETDLSTYLQENFAAGGDGAGKALIIEIEGEDDAETPLNTQKPLFDVHDLNNWKDADFLKYQDSNDKKIRLIWRLPPIITGNLENVNRATAEVSKEIAEEQVFNPERKDFNELINSTLVPAMFENPLVEFVFNRMEIINLDNEHKKAELATERGAWTLNEIRKYSGQEPLDDPRADVPVFLLNLDQQRGHIKEALQDETVAAKVAMKVFGSDHVQAFKMLGTALSGR